MTGKAGAWKGAVVVSVLMFAAANVAADDPITLPTVTVVAKGGGGNIVCTGAACMDFIAQL